MSEHICDCNPELFPNPEELSITELSKQVIRICVCERCLLKKLNLSKILMVKASATGNVEDMKMIADKVEEIIYKLDMIKKYLLKSRDSLFEKMSPEEKEVATELDNILNLAEKAHLN